MIWREVCQDSGNLSQPIVNSVLALIAQGYHRQHSAKVLTMSDYLQASRITLKCSKQIKCPRN